MKQLRAIFAGGGTGGHLFPALTIADTLKERVDENIKADFLFIGTKKGLEYRMRGELGYPLALINVRGLQRSITLANALFPILLVGSILKSIFIMTRFKPDIVIGTGGYVMAPVILAAVLMRKPRVIQEQNSYPGLATRKLAPMVHRLFLGFGAAARYLKKSGNIVESGNPIKKSIGQPTRQEGLNYFQLDPNKKTIMILGGSLGALKINRNIMSGLERIPDGFQLIWQTGEGDYKDVAAFAGGRVSSRALVPFISRIELAYAAADLIIARAGAVTLAEIAAAAIPAILVPYPFATGNHQMINAREFAAAGAAVIIENERLDEISLLDAAVRLFENGQFEKMDTAAQTQRDKQTESAANIIVNEILELINFKKE